MQRKCGASACPRLLVALQGQKTGFIVVVVPLGLGQELFDVAVDLAEAQAGAAALVAPLAAVLGGQPVVAGPGLLLAAANDASSEEVPGGQRVVAARGAQTGTAMVDAAPFASPGGRAAARTAAG